MKIDFKNEIEIEGVSENRIKAKIADKNLPFIIDLITRQQYRDPIGSIVREITSNCFDAHIEAGVDKPVTISFKEDGLGEYILFKDVGIGMTPSRITDVYLSYGESTKRDSDGEIGGFGLGGKSPLAYAESFYLTTVSNHIKYEYLVFKGELLPEIEPLNEEETTEGNGTEVKIYFKQKDDKYLFINACKKQLTYFDNVYFTNTYMFNNNYKIYDGTHFKVRSDVNTDRYSSQAHLCVGKVAYPIDYNILNIDPINIPIAIKFEIGDLIVTPERESLRYVKVKGVETKTIILKKLYEAIEELKTKYYAQESLVCETIIEYLDRRKEAPVLIIHEVTLNLDDVIEENNIKCKPLTNYLGRVQKDIFEVYNFKCNLYQANRKKKEYHIDVTLEKLKNNDLYITKGGKESSIKNKYIMQLKDVSAIKVGRFKFIGWKRLYRLSGLSKLALPLPYNTSILQQVKLLKSIIDNEIKQHTIDYDEITPTREFIASQASFKPTIKRKEEEIVVYDWTIEKVSFRKKYVKPSLFEKFSGFVIFGFDEDSELLDNMVKLFNQSMYNTHKILTNSKAIKIIKTSQSNVKHFRNMKNVVHVSQFIGDNKVFKHFATALIVNKENKFRDLIGKKKESISLYTVIDMLSLTIVKTVNDLDDFECKYINKIEDLDESFVESIIDVAKKYSLVDKDMILKLNEINTYVDRLELLEHVNFSYKIIPYVVEYFVLKNKEVCELWTNPKEYEVALIKESAAKIDYLDELSEESNRVHWKESFTQERNIQQSLLNYYNYAKSERN